MPYTLAEENRARRSGWHYLFLLFSIVAWGAIWGAILLPFYALRLAYVPRDAFFWGETGLGGTFFELPPMFAAIAICLPIGRFFVRLIPAARTALEPELGDDADITSSINNLAKWGRVALIVVLPLCFLGAQSIWAITPTEIEVRPVFSAATRFYDWSSVRTIDTGCAENRHVSYHFLLGLDDGTRIDLMQNDPFGFVAAYPKVQSALEGHTYGFSNAAFVGTRCSHYPRRSWQEMLTNPPTDAEKTANRF
jgi:hypothetical protein